MKAKTKIMAILILGALCAQALYAEAVRGRLDGMGPYGLYPVTGIAVTVSSSRGRSAPSYTDYQGMYYIYRLAPGPHTLEIWVSNQPMLFPITVYPRQPMTDIAPIRVR